MAYVIRHDEYGYYSAEVDAYGYRHKGESCPQEFFCTSGGFDRTVHKIPKKATRYATREEANEEKDWSNDGLPERKVVKVKERTISEKLKALLDRLGKHPASEIAALLEKKGVTGIRKDGFSCAITMYIKSQLPDVKGLSTGTSMVRYRNTVDGPTETLDNPPSVKEFIRAFDAYEYPNLVR